MNLGGWTHRHDDIGRLHVLPVSDLREHLPYGCWCKPVEDEELPTMIVHNSMDERERFETGERRLQ